MNPLFLKIFLLITILINFTFSFDCNFFPILKKLYTKNTLHYKYSYTRGDAKKHRYNNANLIIRDTTTDFIKVSNKNNYNIHLRNSSNINNNITNISKLTSDFTKFITL